jgi:hypothetical protein
MTSLDDVLSALNRLPDDDAPAGARGWSLAQTLVHCAQSIEYSVTQYPVLKPKWFRGLIGPLAKRKFLRAGTMSHDKARPIPGAPDIDAAPLPEARERLRASIAAFRAHDRQLAPHFAYGACTKDEYERLHTMHVADHLGSWLS